MAVILASTKFPSTLAEALKEMMRLPGNFFLPIEGAAVQVGDLTVALFAVGRDDRTGYLYGLGAAQDRQATCCSFCRRDREGNWDTVTLKGSGWPEQWIAQNAEACFTGALRAVDVLRNASWKTAVAC